MTTRSPRNLVQHPLSLAISCALLGSSLASPVVMAQQTQDAPNNATQTEAALTDKQQALEAVEQDEVVVIGTYTTNDMASATGLGISIQETPQSATIMTSQRIEDQGLENVKDIVLNIAGVSAQQRDTDRFSFAARGFDILNVQIDGASAGLLGNADATSNAAIYERIELVRGATGLMTGSGEPSASINLIRKHADADELTGNISVTGGRWNYRSASADVQGPLNESGTVRGRIVGDISQGESHRDVYETDDKTIYGVLDIDITEDTFLSFGASHQKRAPKGSTWGGLPTWYDDGTRTNFERSKTTAADWNTITRTENAFFVNLKHQFNEKWALDIAMHRLQVDADWKVLWSEGAPNRDTGIGRTLLPTIAKEGEDTSVLDIKLNGLFEAFGREHELILGMRNAKANSHWDGADSIPGEFNNIDFNSWNGKGFPEPLWEEIGDAQMLHYREKGYFAATRLHFSDDLKLILGARYSEPKASGNYIGFPIDVEVKEKTTPYAGVLYDITDQHRIYASYTEIFTPQLALTRKGKLIVPKDGKSYEAGLKSRFFEGDLETTVSLFRIEQDNLAVPDTGFFVPGTPLPADRPANGTRTEGFELEAIGNLSEGWDLHFSYTDFDVKEGRDSSSDYNPTGEINTHQPRKMLKLFSVYQLQGELDALKLGGGVNWQSDTYVDTTNDVTNEKERLSQGSYALFNLMASYEFSPELSAQLNVDNVFDKVYFSNLGFYSQYDYGTPRNVKLKLEYSF